MSELTKAQPIHVAHEEEERSRLLQAVSITEQGVAVCEHPVSATVMKLVAVRVSDDGQAEHMPFEEDQGTVRLGLPGDIPSQIGFFLGHTGSREVSGVFRVGSYPGEPLLTARKAEGNQEVLVGMSGIKATELDDQLWADQIGLFETLDFDPRRTRGIFSKAHQALPGARTWDEQRIVVLPKAVNDLVEVVGPDVRGDVYQVLGYEIAPPKPRYPLLSTELDSISFAMRSGTTRGAPKSFGGELTTGFGSEFETTVRLGAISVVGLQGAFEVNIAPES